LMRELEERFIAMGVVFHRDGDRIRCFPHVINLAVEAFLEGLDESAKVFRKTELVTEHTDEDEYLKALESDVLAIVRLVVRRLRASGQRRDQFAARIEQGNQQHHWDVSGDVEHVILDVLQLLRDCETRWSPTFYMIERFLYLFPAILAFVNENQRELGAPYIHFSPSAHVVLTEIFSVLEFPHRVQELLSAEKTPTLSLALPLYEQLIRQWREVAEGVPQLRYAIMQGVIKLEEYVVKSRQLRIHALAM
ncbi:hypothetical protein BDV93DRAFT_392795, partial [Ceratobasidium sp. AG-I]